MKLEQRLKKEGFDWEKIKKPLQEYPRSDKVNLVLGFGGTESLTKSETFEEIRILYPEAQIILGSTSGEIHDSNVTDKTVIITALELEKTPFKVFKTEIKKSNDSESVAIELAKSIPKEDLTYLFILSDGINVNATAFLKGLQLELPTNVTISGGLCGDGISFRKTVIGYNEIPKSNQIVVLAFYGKNIEVGQGCFGGWNSYGPESEITKSKGNILYEIDGKSALSTYKELLPSNAQELPVSGLLYSLSIFKKNSNERLVRTILGIDEENQALIFAGDVPQNHRMQLMNASFENLITGAGQAAQQTLKNRDAEVQLAILISCVGRRLVLGPRTAEEVKAVRNILGVKPSLMGFYSYGELSTNINSKSCELHNQTMTITTLREK
jgi:hypothetical protein